MAQGRRKRWVWLAAGASTLGSYAACAWLWAAPFHGAPQSLRAPRPRLEIASVSTPLTTASALAVPVLEASAAPLETLRARTPSLQNTRNFLLIGLDRRPDGSGAALADTLIVVVIDERHGHVGLVSIPRDLYVDIPEAGTDRINTVYAVARRTKRDPLTLLRRVVQDTLKLPLEHGLALDLGVFERAVDAVGGVTVEVPCAIRDRFLDPRAEGGRRVLDLEEGRQHLDGATAAMYARSRHGRSDWNRARRQQAVLLGLKSSLSGLGALRLPELWSALESSVETDLRRIDLLALGQRALELSPSHLHGLVIGYEHTRGFVTAEGKAVLLPDYPAIDAALAKLFSTPSPGTPPKLAQCAPKDAALNRLSPPSGTSG